MSRRASVFARTNPGKRRVRFPDEVIFEDEIKEQDGHAIMSMLRRASVDVDINRINTAGKNDKIVILFGSSRISPCIIEGQQKDRTRYTALALWRVIIFSNESLSLFSL